MYCMYPNFCKIFSKEENSRGWDYWAGVSDHLYSTAIPPALSAIQRRQHKLYKNKYKPPSPLHLVCNTVKTLTQTLPQVQIQIQNNPPPALFAIQRRLWHKLYHKYISCSTVLTTYQYKVWSCTDEQYLVSQKVIMFLSSQRLVQTASLCLTTSFGHWPNWRSGGVAGCPNWFWHF